MIIENWRMKSIILTTLFVFAMTTLVAQEQSQFTESTSTQSSETIEPQTQDSNGVTYFSSADPTLQSRELTVEDYDMMIEGLEAKIELIEDKPASDRTAEDQTALDQANTLLIQYNDERSELLNINTEDE